MHRRVEESIARIRQLADFGSKFVMQVAPLKKRNDTDPHLISVLRWALKKR